jgi:chemotaxis signal transduction protein
VSVTLESEFCIGVRVVDLRAKFGMETTEVTVETCIIVVETSQRSRKFSTGVVVDRVQDV